MAMHAIPLVTPKWVIKKDGQDSPLPQVGKYTRFSPFFNPDACKAIFAGICVFRACFSCSDFKSGSREDFQATRRIVA